MYSIFLILHDESYELRSLQSRSFDSIVICLLGQDPEANITKKCLTPLKYWVGSMNQRTVAVWPIIPNDFAGNPIIYSTYNES